ncbi:hypothetical protein [Streptacidiphilus fuscans]|uniref:DUF8175 domain-containing protein n=1 Tax=Streptacidiphilus fuscans TaxID=2789292 RepID=A0A931FHF3_9ACTN|nr:hypothetical protein [Streptacidiphilus fuscans]MBF9072320.1 hypothetical protein [Streptacidiphilus fuscans]
MSFSDDQPHTRTRLPAGEQPTAPQASGLRRLKTLAAVFVIVFLMVVAVAVINRTNGSANSGGGNGTSNDAGSAPGASASATAPTGTQPVTTTQNGIGVQYPHTSEGAQSAAANYSVALGSSEMYATASRHAIVATVTDPSVTSTLQGQFDSSYAAQAAKLGLTNGQASGGLVFVCRPNPVGTKLDSYSQDKATVEIWTNGLIGLAGQGSTSPVTEFWFTMTLQLHWANGDWKVLAYSQVDGPTPVSGNQPASDSTTIANAATQFGGFRYAR